MSISRAPRRRPLRIRIDRTAAVYLIPVLLIGTLGLSRPAVSRADGACAENGTGNTVCTFTTANPNPNTWTVPADVFGVEIYVAGAQGGGPFGGLGGTVTGVFGVTPGEEYTITVGTSGDNPSIVGGGGAGGGPLEGNPIPSGSVARGGRGGGATAIVRETVGSSQVMVVAGGGGGQSGDANDGGATMHGGNGGSPAGEDGEPGGITSGRGAPEDAAGAGGAGSTTPDTCLSGSFDGADGSTGSTHPGATVAIAPGGAGGGGAGTGGGGGGGGYHGGGGGGGGWFCNDSDLYGGSAGGGGGSSYADDSVDNAIFSFGGSGDGQVTITFTTPPTPTAEPTPTDQPTSDVSFPPPTTEPLAVSVYTASPGGPQDLTAAGTTDWAIWGYGQNGTSTDLSPDVRKAGGSGISALTAIEPALDPNISLRGLGQFIRPDCAPDCWPVGLPKWTFDWTNGDDVGSATGAAGGLQWNGTSDVSPFYQPSVGYGFSFTVPASPTRQRLQVWTHAHGGSGFLEATLSGAGSTSLSYGNGGYGELGLWTIDFEAPGPETLTVEYTLYDTISGGNAVSANAAIYAAAVSPIGPSTTVVPAPTLLQAVPTILAGNVPGTGVIGMTPTPGSYDLDFFTEDQCVGGQLSGTPRPVGSFSITTTADEPYFVGGFTNTDTVGSHLAVAIGGPASVTSDLSACVVVGPDNDIWTRALDLPLSGGATQLQGFLDAPGNARWYRFAIAPGARVTVDLTGVPGDYDAFLFKDISKAYTDLTSTQDLTKLSAEFAPSAFAPSAFAPSAFAPSAFAPSAFAPSAFAPSAFAPSAFAPSAFAPSAFAPSAFAPSAFAPSAFAPSAFAPSAFAPSAFAPSAFAPSAFAPAEFASAQVRSLIGISAQTGTAPESIVGDTWNNTGYFYVRVSGKNGVFDANAPFTLRVTQTGTECGSLPAARGALPTIPAGDYTTLILTDTGRMTGSTTTMTTRLNTFRARPEVKGAVVDVGPTVAALNTQATTDYDCPYAKNLVASGIKDIVEAFRTANPNLRYVVLVGDDNVIPFFRYPDQSLLGPEQDYRPPVGGTTTSEGSLRGNFVLGQDEYGAATSISMRASDFPIPDLAVGRLVETPAEIVNVLDQYLTTTGGVASNTTTSLVTGYDFIADSAKVISDELTAGTGRTTQELITASDISPQDSRSWTASQLRTALLGARHDLIFLGGHFNASSALAADFTTSLLTSELTGSTVNLANAIVFSIGCHAGYNTVDSHGIPTVTDTLDWAQAFARKGAALIAGTGYQYGDTDFVEYSERIYAEFAHQLRVGTGPVSIGEALVAAKQAYLRQTPDIRGLHEKALLESTLFGLPMLSVNLPGRVSAPSDGSAVGALTGYGGSGPGATLGLQYADLTVDPTTQAQHRTLTNLAGGTIPATFYTGPDGNTTNPGEPALPLDSVNVTASGTVLRGVGFRSGSYAESTVTPLTGAPNTEIRGVHVPFASTVFYPMRPWTVNYYDALGTPGGATRLLVTPAQHRTPTLGSLTSTLRLFSDMDLRLFYSSNTTTYAGGSTPALSAPPTITDVSAEVDGTVVTFRAHVVGDPAAGIQEVWATYTGDQPRWASVDLAQDPTDSTLWVGSHDFGSGLAATDLRFMVQAVNGVGLVSMADNLGAYFSASIAGTPSPNPASASIVLAATPTSGLFGSTQTVAATLSSSGPVGGRPVVFTLGGAVRIATTNGSGVATTSIDVTSPIDTTLSASFGGDDQTGPASASRAFVVSKAGTSMSMTGPTVLPQAGAGQVAATLSSAGVPLTGRTVAFRIKTMPSGPEVVQTAITDLTGIARVSVPTAALGTFRFAASFGGPVALPAGGTLDLTDPVYGPSSATLSPDVVVRKAQTITFTSTAPATAVYGDTYTPAAKATPSSLTVTLAVTGDCSLASGKVTFTKSGSCTVTATQAGNTTYAPATPVSQVITIGKKTATLGYTGSLFVSAGSGTSTNVTLTAQITKATGGTVDLTKAKVAFQLFRSTNTSGIADATCPETSTTVNSSGVATCVLDLSLDDWTVIVSLPSTNAYWTAPDSDAVVLTVYQTSMAKYAIGGGNITYPSSGATGIVKPSTTKNRGHFGFAVSYRTGTTPQGVAVYRFRATDGYDYVFTTSSWTGGGLSFGTSAKTASFSQRCSVTVFNPATGRVVSGLGGSNFTCRYDVTDASTDKFAMSAYTSAGVLYHQVGTPTAQLSLTGGGIVVKK